jgi:hypothetical protein
MQQLDRQVEEEARLQRASRPTQQPRRRHGDQRPSRRIFIYAQAITFLFVAQNVLHYFGVIR